MEIRTMFDYFLDKLQSADKFRIDLSKSEKDGGFRHNRERSMPIASVFGKMGFFLFPSENSYDLFKRCKFDFGPLEGEGMGVPLFELRRTFEILGSYTGNSPTYIIYKYVVLSSDHFLPSAEVKVLKRDNDLQLCRFPFCEIYQRIGIKNIEYKLVFAFDGVETKHLHMIRRTYDRDLFTRLNDQNLRWHVSYSPIHDEQYRLAVLEENYPSLLDDPDTRKKKKLAKTQNKEGRVIGHYTKKYRDILPKTVFKQASVILGEWSDSPSYGVSSIPWQTEALACEALLIHYTEYEENK